MVVSSYEESVKGNAFLKLMHIDRLENARKQLNLKLLKEMGKFQGNVNQWNIGNETKVKTIMRYGNMEEILLSLIVEGNYPFLLCDYSTFTRKLLPFNFVFKTKLTQFKLWIFPNSLTEFRINPLLNKEQFEFRKKWLFNDLFALTKLYNLPTDNTVVKRDFDSRFSVN